MNLPNKLTVLRIIMTPIFLVALLLEFPFHNVVALLLFIAASLTDMIDGKIARKHNLITNFGKFLDPIADKMLTTAAFLAFIHLNVGAGSVWIAFIVLTREFLITSIRLSAATTGKVIAANSWGKAKTVAQMVAIIFAIFAQVMMYDLGAGADTLAGIIFSSITSGLLWLSAILTVISGVIYLIDNIECLDFNN